MEKKLEVELKGVPLTEQQTDVLMPLLVQHMQRRMKRSKFEARAMAMLAGAGCPLLEVKP